MAEQARPSLSERAPFILSQNEIEVVNAIRKYGPLSRTELARHLHVSRANITNITTELLRMQVLWEVGVGESQGGRRPLMLDINSQLGVVAGIDIGATSLDVALADFNGNILQRTAEAADVMDEPEIVLARVCQLICEMADKQQVSQGQIFAIGVGVPGPVEFSKGILIAPPLMPKWESYPIKAFIRKTFPVAQVVVDNDVNVMAIGEQQAGGGQGVENFILLKIGTGIGAGIICKGDIYRGSHGCAGDVGHICVDYNGPICRCGNRGCLEAMAGGPAIAARAEEITEKGLSPILKELYDEQGFLTAVEVGQAAARGDPFASEIIRGSGRMVGGMLASLVNFFNPQIVFIGGGVSNIGYQLLSSIRQSVLRRSNPLSTRSLRIEYSRLGEDIGVLGAIWLSLQHVFVVKK